MALSTNDTDDICSFFFLAEDGLCYGVVVVFSPSGDKGVSQSRSHDQLEYLLVFDGDFRDGKSVDNNRFFFSFHANMISPWTHSRASSSLRRYDGDNIGTIMSHKAASSPMAPGRSALSFTMAEYIPPWSRLVEAP